MKLPLYKVTQKTDRLVRGNGNSGLWYDKFCNKWKVSGQDFNSWSLKSTTNENPKLDWIKSVRGKVGDSTLLLELFDRRKALLAAHNQEPLFFNTEGPLVTGLGRSHPVENGFCWHHQLGVPYLPGSSVKGLVRNWIEQWGDGKYCDQLLPWFGSVCKSELPRQTGGYIFLDALPVFPPELGVDILTPHMGKWYEKGGSEPDRPETLPADWHDPVPAPFLVVKEATFLFSILPRTSEFAKSMDQIEECLTNALQWLGAGAKTAVGYGRMKKNGQAIEKIEQRQQEIERQRQQRSEQRAEESRIAALSPEEKLREEVQKFTEKKITQMFGKNYNRIAKEYQQDGLLQNLLEYVEEFHGPLIRSWQSREKKSLNFKAYKKFGRLHKEKENG